MIRISDIDKITSISGGFFLQTTAYKTALDIQTRVDETFSEKYQEFINAARPNINDEEKAYFGNIMKQIGNPARGFLSTVLNKYKYIPLSAGYFVNYDNLENANIFKEQEDFFWKHIFSWITKKPNSVLFVLPKIDVDISAKTHTIDYKSPVLHFEPCKNVMKYSKDYAVITSSEKSKINGESGLSGRIIYIINDYGFIKLIEYDKGHFYSINGGIKDDLMLGIPHNSKKMPCFRIGIDVEYQDYVNGDLVLTGLLDNCVPEIRQAIGTFLDKITTQKLASNPFITIIGAKECNSCDAGKVSNLDIDGQEYFSTCDKCNGKGRHEPVWNGFVGRQMTIDTGVSTGISGEDNKLQINMPSKFVEIQKGDTESVMAFAELEKQQYENALKILNMDIMNATSFNSGEEAKIVRQDLNQSVSVLAKILCGYLQNIFDATTDIIFAEKGNKKAEYLQIRVPSEFDLKSKTDIINDISLLKTNKLSPYLVSFKELELAGKEFGKDSLKYKKEEFLQLLNPLSGLSDVVFSESLAVLSNNDKILATQALRVINLAEMKDPEFWEEKKTNMDRYNSCLEISKKLGETLVISCNNKLK